MAYHQLLFAPIPRRAWTGRIEQKKQGEMLCFPQKYRLRDGRCFHPIHLMHEFRTSE